MERPTVKREYMDGLMRFLDQVEKLRGAADGVGIWVTPSPEDCLAFAVTEAGEAVDAMLRQNPAYTRSHQKGASLEHELGDMAVMLASYLIQNGLPSDDTCWPVWPSKDKGALRIIDSVFSAWSFRFVEKLNEESLYHAIEALVDIIALLGSNVLTAHVNYLWDKWVAGKRQGDKIVSLAYCPTCDWYFPPDTSECTGCHGPTKPAYMKQIAMDSGEGV